MVQYSSSAFHFTLALTQRKSLRALASGVGFLADDPGGLAAERGREDDVRRALAQAGAVPIGRQRLHLGLVQPWVVGKGAIFKDLLEFHRLGRVGDLLLKIDCALGAPDDGVALDGTGRYLRGLGRGAQELDVALLAVFLGEGQPDADPGTGFDARGVGPERQRVGDAVANGVDLDLARLLGFLDDGLQMVGEFPRRPAEARCRLWRAGLWLVRRRGRGWSGSRRK